MISDYKDLADFILKNYNDKVVEVGAGSMPHVALILKEKLDVIVTDVTYSDNGSKHPGIRFCRDDIFNPDMDLYKNASLIYSIRPPIDIQEVMARVAKEVGADLIIRPFGNEKADLSMIFKSCSLLNYKTTRFYLYHG
ncbi:Uncharacterised protein [uncultured archaeon]|nr:Uncharacterised protein [uncultured archaeon]